MQHMSRTPDEILTVFDQAQAELERSDPGTYSLRDLLWEVLEDVLDSTKLAALQPHPETAIHDRPMEVHTTLEDYLANHYGDD